MSDAVPPEVARPPAPVDQVPPAPKNGRASEGRANGRERADGHDRSNGHPSGHDGLDATGRAILRTLCEAGATSPDLLATRLGLSRTSALQRLRELAMAGLVARQAIRHGVGRPRHLYDVTPAAQAILPANYDGLATTLLESIEQVGGDALVDEVFQARRRLLRERIRTRLADRLGDGASLQARVRELAVLQDDAGYVSRSESGPDGGLELVQHNCAILGAAAGHPAACRAEIELYEEVLDARVTRVSHIASGDRTCTYRIEPRR